MVRIDKVLSCAFSFTFIYHIWLVISLPHWFPDEVMDSWVESIGRREQHNLLCRSEVKRLTNLVLASSKTSLSAAEMKSRPRLIGRGKGRGGRQGGLVSRVGDGGRTSGLHDITETHSTQQESMVWKKPEQSVHMTFQTKYVTGLWESEATPRHQKIS